MAKSNPSIVRSIQNLPALLIGITYNSTVIFAYHRPHSIAELAFARQRVAVL